MVAKFDRLPRDVAFISGLKPQRVPFISPNSASMPISATVACAAAQRTSGLAASTSHDA
jgi:hypothetical protein